MTPDAKTDNGVLFAVDMSVLEPELSYGALFALDAGSASQPISEVDDLGQFELSAWRYEIIGRGADRLCLPPLRGKVSLRSNDG